MQEKTKKLRRIYSALINDAGSAYDVPDFLKSEKFDVLVNELEPDIDVNEAYRYCEDRLIANN